MQISLFPYEERNECVYVFEQKQEIHTQTLSRLPLDQNQEKKRARRVTGTGSAQSPSTITFRGCDLWRMTLDRRFRPAVQVFDWTNNV